MSSFEDNSDRKYQLIELHAFTDDNSASNDTKKSCSSYSEESQHIYTNCEKMDKIFMHIACVPRLPTNQSRSKCSKTCVTIINLFFSLMSLTSIYTAFKQLIVHLRGSEVTDAVRLFYVCCVDIIRILVVIYILFYFNYPWHLNPKLLPIDVTPAHKTKLYLIIITISTLIEVSTVGSAMCLGGDPFFWYVGLIVNYVFWQIPNYCVPVLIQCGISYKYQLYLSQLANISDTIDVYHIFDAYKTIYYEFKKDYHVILVLCVTVKLICILAPIWMLGYEYKTDDDNLLMHPWLHKTTGVFVMDTLWIGLSSTATIVPLAISGMYLNETFESLEKLWWKQVEDCMEKKCDSQIIMTLILYMKKHPVCITFAGVQISLKSTVIFSVSFIASRIAAKMVSILY